MLLCIGGGVVEGLIDSFDIEPRVRFAGRFGKSNDFREAFFSLSFVALVGLAENLETGMQILKLIFFVLA